jgi:DNA-binding response OmpR family regulator
MHILVVEDQRDSAEHIRKYLETESYSVNLAFDGEPGLRPEHESREQLQQFTQDASHEPRMPLAVCSRFPWETG